MYKKLLLIAFLVAACLPARTQTRVAILPAADKTGEVKEGVSLLISSSLTSAVFETEGLEAYDRIDLSALLNEQDYLRMGVISDPEIRSIGEQAGAGYVLIPETVWADDVNVEVAVRIVEVATVETVSQADVTLSLDVERIESGCQNLAGQLFGNRFWEGPRKTAEAATPEIITAGTDNGYDWVDLGLSVKWATCNIGADTPEAYGDYYAWGETVTKEEYSWGTYPWIEEKLTKYNTSEDNGVVDDKTVLEDGDDIAHLTLGGQWRMPTFAEFEELLENCKVEMVTRNDVNGMRFTSRKPGYTHVSIFLPAAGFMDVTTLKKAGVSGFYWSSSLGTDYTSRSWGIDFESISYGAYRSYRRYYGQSIRPVTGGASDPESNPE